MKNLLLGNGINIQFGGVAYNSDFILKRIKYRAKLDENLELFDNKIDSSEFVSILNNFVEIANKIKSGYYDSFVSDNDTKEAVDDFKERYKTWTVHKPHDVMLEDWFLLVHVFFIENIDLENSRKTAVQGFEHLILDGIYNGGKLQELYYKMSENKKVRNYFKSYDCIFTLNYDNNIENLTGKTVFHLHGDYSVLHNSENENNVQGFLRKLDDETVYMEKFKHCFCNALLNYSGKLKKKIISDMHNLIVESDRFEEKYRSDAKFISDLEHLKITNPFFYKMIITKIEHPGLNMATEYHLDDFSNIEGELSVIGMSPNNDAHIFDAILNNKKLSKVIFYYFDETHKQYIETHFSKELFKCESVNSLWTDLDCARKSYNCNHISLAQDIDKFVDIVNALSDDPISKEILVKKVNQIPDFEIKRLCSSIEEEKDKRKLNQAPANEEELLKQFSSISYVALQEGILPSVLYMIYIMNKKK